MPVVAAGSLLEFVLKDYPHSMPVDRITYAYLEPMSFFEFVLASGNEPLHGKLSTYVFGEKIAQTLHEKCLEQFHDYCLIGGMPEVVREWIENRDVASCMSSELMD